MWSAGQLRRGRPALLVTPVVTAGEQEAGVRAPVHVPNLHQTTLTYGLAEVVALITRLSGEIVEARTPATSPHPAADETNRARGPKRAEPSGLERPHSHGVQVTLQVPTEEVPVGAAAPVVAAKVAGQVNRVP